MNEQTTEEKKPFDLNDVIFRLLLDEPFFAALSRQIDKTASMSVPTAGVTLDSETKQFRLLYNPEWFATLSEAQVRAVLKHEFYHIIFEHIQGDRIPREAMLADHRRWNIAMDLAINGFLKAELPLGCCIPGAAPYAELPEGKVAEWYHANLPKQEKGKGKGKGSGAGAPGDPGDKENNENDDGQFDDHSLWDKLSNEDRALAKARTQEILGKAAAEAAKNNSWGSVPADVQKDILRRLAGYVDWRKVLRYFIRTSKRAEKHATVRKLNRKYPYIHSGIKVRRQANIAISMDESGSVGDELLAIFFAELDGLAQLATFTVIPFDSEVQESTVYVWKKGTHVAARRIKCGGTCFDAPTNYVNKHREFDGHIVLTDLCAPAPGPSRCQRIWMTSEACAAQPYFTTNELIIGIPVETR